MANSVLPNTFQNPNEYVDQAMELLSSEEFKCLIFATRHILGWQETFNTRQRPMSFTMFETGFDSKETVEKPSRHFGGTGLSRKAIGDALHELVKYRFLEKGDRVGEGQVYYLSEEPDWDGLKKRAAELLEKNLKRTANARAIRAASKSDQPDTAVSDTNQFACSQTNQPDYTQLVELTDNQLDRLTNEQLAAQTEQRLVGLKESNPQEQTHNQTHLQTQLKDSAPQNGAVAALEPKTIAPPIDFPSKQERPGLMEQSVIARKTPPLQPVAPQEPALTPEQAAKALRDAKKQIGADVDPVKERKRDVIFDAVAVHVFGITSDDELKALDSTEHAGTRIGIITSWLRQKSDRVRLANGRRGAVVGFISHVAEPAHIEKFGAWCRDKQFDPPKDLVKFVENWRAFASEIKASKELDGKKYISGDFADAINH